MKAYGLPLTDDHDNCFGICITEDGKYLGQWTSSNYLWLERDLKTHADGYDYEFKQKPNYTTIVQLLVLNSKNFQQSNKALNAIDDHIRQMRVDGIITMEQMGKALKVISSNLK